MKSTKIKILLIFMVFLIVSISIIPAVYAKPRNTYITDFLYDCEIADEGFSNSVENDDDENEQATAYALEILEDFDLLQKKDIFGTVEYSINTSELAEELEGDTKDELGQSTIDIYDLYYLLWAVDILEDTNEDFDPSSSLDVDSKNFLDSLKNNDGGFGSTPSSESTLASTYYAVNIYKIIDESFNETSLKSWVRSCQNYDGGYGGNIGSSSSIINTFYAAIIMDELDDVDELSGKERTIEYLKSFYEDDENDEANYGGYYPNEDSEKTLISSTYYCVKTISLIDDSELEDEEITLSWILNHQNFKDGGFADKSDRIDEQKYSSVVNTYQAYQIIKILDEDLEILNEPVFMVEFNWWILVGLLIGIGVGVVIFFYIRRKRRL
jgi:prenyltransferase beta subunit